MIYIYRHDVLVRDEKGQLKNLPNHYGRYKDKELIIGYSGEEFLDKIVSEDVFQKYDYLFEKGGSDSGNVNNDAVDDNWGEPVSMEHDFSVEEMLDMPTECDVQNKYTF